MIECDPQNRNNVQDLHERSQFANDGLFAEKAYKKQVFLCDRML